jgi:hypothetical protein
MLDPKELNSSLIAKHFSDEEEAYKLIEGLRWPNGPVCFYCQSVNRAYFLEPKEGSRKTSTGVKLYCRVWKCADCRKQYFLRDTLKNTGRKNFPRVTLEYPVCSLLYSLYRDVLSKLTFIVIALQGD